MPVKHHGSAPTALLHRPRRTPQFRPRGGRHGHHPAGLQPQHPGPGAGAWLSVGGPWQQGPAPDAGRPGGAATRAEPGAGVGQPDPRDRPVEQAGCRRAALRQRAGAGPATGAGRGGRLHQPPPAGADQPGRGQLGKAQPRPAPRRDRILRRRHPRLRGRPKLPDAPADPAPRPVLLPSATSAAGQGQPVHQRPVQLPAGLDPDSPGHPQAAGEPQRQDRLRRQHPLREHARADPYRPPDRRHRHRQRRDPAPLPAARRTATATVAQPAAAATGFRQRRRR